MPDESTGVLVVGRSQLVLDAVLETLTERGYRAVVSRDADDITEQVDAAALDVVVFGGQVTQQQKAEMRAALSAVRPDLAFLQGLAGIPGLIVDQIDGWVNRDVSIAGQAPVYEPDERAIRLVLFAPLQVEVTVYWITELVPPDPKSTSVVLANGPLPEGRHTFRVPDGVALDLGFASVRAGAASWSFPLGSS